MAIKLKVWGKYACFSRPELKSDRMSYNVITPSAAIGILEAIFWHPGMQYKIDKLYVLNPIKFTTIWRNEVKSKISASLVQTAIKKGDINDLFINRKKEILQRSSTVLQDVCYIIEAHFNIGGGTNETDNAGKFQDMLVRRAEKGQCYHRPYMGVREFPANFKLFKGKDIKTAYEGETIDLGLMLHHLEYDKRQLKGGEVEYYAEPAFFNAVMVNGVIDLTSCEVLK